MKIKARGKAKLMFSLVIHMENFRVAMCRSFSFLVNEESFLRKRGQVPSLYARPVFVSRDANTFLASLRSILLPGHIFPPLPTRESKRFCRF